MADSMLTKKALADALKAQLIEEPLDKISIGEICERCSLNRKSFYYHFDSKPDLVNWIFDTEFFADVASDSDSLSWQDLETLCGYLYDHKNFYRKVLKSQDADFFTSHLKELIEPLLSNKLKDITASHLVTDFQLIFFTDAFIFTISRWLTDSKLISCEEFFRDLISCIYIPVQKCMVQ